MIRIIGYGLAMTNDHSGPHLMRTQSPTVCEYPEEEAAATLNIHVDDQGRHIIKRLDGTIWGINKNRTALLSTDNGFNTVTSYSLPEAISGRQKCYMGIDFRGNDPIVHGKAGVFAYSMTTEQWYDISGNINLSGAIQDSLGLRPKLIAGVIR